MMQDAAFVALRFENAEIGIVVESKKSAFNEFPAHQRDFNRTAAPVRVQHADGGMKPAIDHSTVSIHKPIKDEDGERLKVRNHGQDVDQPRSGVRQRRIVEPWRVVDVHTNPDREQLTSSLFDEQSGKLLSSAHQIVWPTESRLGNVELFEAEQQVMTDHK